MITFSRYVSHLYRYAIKDYQTTGYAYCIEKVIDNQQIATYKTICRIMGPLPAPTVMDLLFNFNAF